ncbi:hypothetical protein AB0C68_39305 [Streptomyces tendae]|uniref:DUF6207 family protein n=1 Tax=Streptomyces tendae TaxID=1932 RepID=UPI0033F1F8CD
MAAAERTVHEPGEPGVRLRLFLRPPPRQRPGQRRQRRCIGGHRVGGHRPSRGNASTVTAWRPSLT